MDERLRGKTALVTGGTSGIGRAIAEGFAAQGARVAVGGRDSARGEQVVDTITTAGGQATFLHADLDGTEHTSADIADRASTALGGRVDVLVNNAAVVPLGTTSATTDSMLDEAWAINVKGPLFLVKHLAPGMVTRGDGAVVNITSWMGATGTGVVTAYAATKAALEQLTRDWAVEYGPSGVRVNAISPGVVRDAPTPDDPGLTAMVGTPHGRALRPRDIAAAAVFLASDAEAMHGAVLHVDGGRAAVTTFG